ncbi:hypothetical protein BDR04DRAFT_1112159 [Suillus decipiens]|nr:hypothetical protein BDR04DRAFT_1112159 [Suillus decipiens]
MPLSHTANCICTYISVVIVCKLTSSNALVLIPILIGLETLHGKEIHIYCPSLLLYSQLSESNFQMRTSRMLPFRAGHKRRASINYVA